MDRFARGNQGLKDTVMVLKWIQNNIDKFGGDPTRVTLFGESYGSMSTTMHLISSMSNGKLSYNSFSVCGPEFTETFVQVCFNAQSAKVGPY